MLIIAGVTVSLVTQEEGIINRANQATEEDREKELMKLGYNEYKVAKIGEETSNLKVEGATVTVDEENGWTVKFAKTGNKYRINSKGEIRTMTGGGNTPEEPEETLERIYYVKDGQWAEGY